jgi:integrase
MTSIKLRHVDRFKDRHGRVRYYFRRRIGGEFGPRIALPGEPGSREFMEAYQAALADAPRPKIKPRAEAEPGTFRRLIDAYFASPDFLRLRSSTQRSYRLVIERFSTEHGHRRVDQMTREHVQKIVAARAETPAAANDVLKKLRILVHFAVDLGWRRDDPTLRIKKFAGGEFHTWTEDEIAAFEKRWAIGTRERTAFALHLFTGQRRSDVCKMAWPDVDVAGQSIRVVQAKTGAKLMVPLHAELREALAAWPRKHVAILTTAYGKPFAVAGYGNWFSDAIDKAGLPSHCVAHGLRKAAARRLAEAGCSANEIAAVTGHKTLQEVERYTRAADQKRLASAAVARLPERNADDLSQTFDAGLGSRPKS